MGVMKSSWAWVEKVCQDFRHARWGLSETNSCRRWNSHAWAFLERASMAASCLNVAGVIPASMGSWLAVSCRQLEMILKVLLRVISSLLMCGLLHQTGVQYSAAENTRAWVEMRRVFIAVHHVVPVRWQISATRAVVFALTLTRCCLNVNICLSFTPKFVGADWNCGLMLSTMMFIS